MAPVVGAAPRVLAAPDPADDPFTVAQVAAAADAAYRRGLAEGAAAVREAEHAAAVAAAARVTSGVAGTIASALAEVGAARAADAAALADLALELARAVLGREPHDGGHALLGRVRDALVALDEETLTVAVAPDDVEVLAAGLAEYPGVVVRPDVALAPGEARVTGRFASAPLTRASALAILAEVVHA